MNKPTYINVKSIKNDKNLDLKIKYILDSEKFCTLASVSNNQCHTSLISFTVSSDLSKIVFATPIDTKKYAYISDNAAVSLLFDNRSKIISNINDLVAINVSGEAKIIKDQSLKDFWAKQLISKHKYLEEFIMADTTVLVIIEVSKYMHVTRFQQVSKLIIK